MKQPKLVPPWIEIHHEKLRVDWDLAVNGDEPFRIAQLQQQGKYGRHLARAFARFPVVAHVCQRRKTQLRHAPNVRHETVESRCLRNCVRPERVSITSL